MRNRYLIALGVALIVLGAYLAYRHSKKKLESSEYEEKTSAGMLEIARNSPTGGMMKLGSALNAYARDNSRYPGSLQELYPGYVVSKALIEEIPWNYRTSGDDFVLKKPFYKDNRRMLASLDRTLKPCIETFFDIARVGDSTNAQATNKDGNATSGASTPDNMRVAMLIDPSEQGLLETPVPATPEPLSHEERSFASRIPSAYILEGVEDAVGPVAEASRQYLVWRDDHGTLGFGNVDYPDEETLGICTDGQWFNVKKVQQKPTVPAEPQYIALGSQRTFFGVAIRE